MTTWHSMKQVAKKERNHRLMLLVRRALIRIGYTGIKTTGYVDAYGARLVYHDLVISGVHIMVRAVGHKPTYTEQRLIDHEGYYLQCGGTDVSALCAVLDAALARKGIDTVQHWSSVGTDDD